MTIDRHIKKDLSYDVLLPGLNYRIDEIRSALGIEQLKKLDRDNLRRKFLTERYIEKLSGAAGIIIPWAKPGADRVSSYHIMPVMLLRVQTEKM